MPGQIQENDTDCGSDTMAYVLNISEGETEILS